MDRMFNVETPSILMKKAVVILVAGMALAGAVAMMIWFPIAGYGIAAVCGMYIVAVTFRARGLWEAVKCIFKRLLEI